MPVEASESIIFRTYPLRESDLIVSFFTRDHGKLRGVARRARRPKNNFGSGLERLSHVRVYYFARENRELVNLDRCEIIDTQLAVVGDYAACVALDYIAEVSEHLLPAGESNERFFRLLLSVLEFLRGDPAARVWPAVNYFSLWAVRLSGILPELRVAAESQSLADEIMRTPIAHLQPRAWSSSTARDLRRFLLRTIQEHVERKLLSAPLLESL